MVPNMKDYGKIIQQMDVVNFIMLMEIFTKENGMMIKLMDGEFIYIKMELNMKGNGKMINKMVKVKKNGLMAQLIKELM